MSYKAFMVALCLDIPLKNHDGIYLDMLFSLKFIKKLQRDILLRQNNFRQYRNFYAWNFL